MLFEETRSIRAFVGRIDAGDDVIEALTLLCDANDFTSASLTLSGTLRDVELVRFENGGYVTTVDHAGPFAIVHLGGRIAKLDGQVVLQVDALLAGHGPGGQQLVFGQLRRANADECEFVLETFADLEITRRVDAKTGRFPIASIKSVAAPVAAQPAAPAAPPRERKAPETVSEPIGTAKPPAESGTDKSELSWADAMEASEDIKPASQRSKPQRESTPEPSAEDIYGGYDFDEVLVKAGDILDHPKLGECRVIKVEDDEYAHIRLSRGQIRKLALELIELHHTGERDGKNTFKVRVRK